jgi:hypothetical protein
MEKMNIDSILRDSIPELPPQYMVGKVNPWRRAMNCVLIGLALNAITLNSPDLSYILPTVGMILMLLGFRALRQENGWFKACWIITMLHAALGFLGLVLKATIFQYTEYGMQLFDVMAFAAMAMIICEIFCLQGGFKAVQKKAGLPPHAGGAVALMVWYLLLCLLAIVKFDGTRTLIFAIVLTVAFIFIIRSLFKMSKELHEAGYVIRAASVRVSDSIFVVAVLAVLGLGIACGYLFGNSYPMQWKAVETSKQAEVKEIKEDLIGLGFPEEILEDLTTQDIIACKGALSVVTDVHDYAASKGRIVGGIYRDNGPKELRITGIAVRLPEGRGKWKIFHHFLWLSDPGFYGTEAIQLWGGYQNKNDWEKIGEASGQVLCTKDGNSLAAPYYSLGDEPIHPGSNFYDWMVYASTTATFSMPKGGERYRGYIAYDIVQMRDDLDIADSSIEYTHQHGWHQYPVETAVEHIELGNWKRNSVFFTVKDMLEFHLTEDGGELLD